MKKKIKNILLLYINKYNKRMPSNTNIKNQIDDFCMQCLLKPVVIKKKDVKPIDKNCYI